jgi:hypothetical protein
LARTLAESTMARDQSSRPASPSRSRTSRWSWSTHGLGQLVQPAPPFGWLPPTSDRADQLVGLLADYGYSFLRYCGDDGVADVERHHQHPRHQPPPPAAATASASASSRPGSSPILMRVIAVLLGGRSRLQLVPCRFLLVGLGVCAAAGAALVVLV